MSISQSRWPLSAYYTRLVIINLSSFLIGCYLSVSSITSPSTGSHSEIFSSSSGYKQVISFSLYGNDTVYTTGAVRNAEIIPFVYPGWIARFYINSTVPSYISEELHRLGSEIIELDMKESWMSNGRLWRYLALNDDSVHMAMFRDCDSRITTRELESVNTWLESGYKHHIMRDHPTHTSLIMPGQWSATALSIRSRISFRRAIEFISVKYPELDHISTEEAFLSTFIWPFIKSDVLIHDAFNCELIQSDVESHPFPGPREWHGDYIGRRVIERFDENSDYFINGQKQLNGGIAPVECRLSAEHVEG